MNHLYHTLSPIVLLASFLVLLLSFLSPVPILHERVALLKVEVNTSSSLGKRWMEQPSEPILVHNYRRMVKGRKIRARAAVSAKKSAAAASTTHAIYFGPMGACVRTESNQSNLTCSAPSFTPIFVEALEPVGLSDAAQAVLPDQFPLAPTAIFLALLLQVIALNSVILSALSNHASKKLAFLASKANSLRKTALICGFVSLCIGLAATISLRIQLAKSVRDWNPLNIGVASLGTGFDQLWAGWALEAVSVLMLVAEAITTR